MTPTTPEPDPAFYRAAPPGAEAAHTAALHTVGRLRYYAQTDPHLRRLVEEFDGAVATSLGIAPADVAARTGTEAAPTAQEEAFDEALKSSSLGAPAVQELRERRSGGDRDSALTHRVIERTLADVYGGHDRDGAVELLMSLPGHVTRQVCAVLTEVASITSEAQRRRPDDPPPAT